MIAPAARLQSRTEQGGRTGLVMPLDSARLWGAELNRVHPNVRFGSKAAIRAGRLTGKLAR
jgi:hypothetical protein